MPVDTLTPFGPAPRAAAWVSVSSKTKNSPAQTCRRVVFPDRTIPDPRVIATLLTLSILSSTTLCTCRTTRDSGPNLLPDLTHSPIRSRADRGGEPSPSPHAVVTRITRSPMTTRSHGLLIAHPSFRASSIHNVGISDRN